MLEVGARISPAIEHHNKAEMFTARANEFKDGKRKIDMLTLALQEEALAVNLISESEPDHTTFCRAAAQLSFDCAKPEMARMYILRGMAGSLAEDTMDEFRALARRAIREGMWENKPPQPEKKYDLPSMSFKIGLDEVMSTAGLVEKYKDKIVAKFKIPLSYQKILQRAGENLTAVDLSSRMGNINPFELTLKGLVLKTYNVDFETQLIGAEFLADGITILPVTKL